MWTSESLYTNSVDLQNTLKEHSCDRKATLQMKKDLHWRIVHMVELQVEFSLLIFQFLL